MWPFFLQVKKNNIFLTCHKSQVKAKPPILHASCQPAVPLLRHDSWCVTNGSPSPASQRAPPRGAVAERGRGCEAFSQLLSGCRSLFWSPTPSPHPPLPTSWCVGRAAPSEASAGANLPRRTARQAGAAVGLLASPSGVTAAWASDEPVGSGLQVHARHGGWESLSVTLQERVGGVPGVSGSSRPPPYLGCAAAAHTGRSRLAGSLVWWQLPAHQ